MAIQDAALQPGNEFKGKVALVTGATRNIGRSIALSLAAGGAAVAVNSRVSREAGDKIVQEIKTGGGQADQRCWCSRDRGHQSIRTGARKVQAG